MTRIKQKQVLLLLGTVVALSACGNDPKAANEVNFEKALNAHYAVMKQCIRIGSKPNDEGIIHTEPAEVMGVKASSVKYTYKIVDVEPWAKSPTFSSRFDWLPERLSDQKIEADDDLVLTNNGWVHHSTFKQ